MLAEAGYVKVNNGYVGKRPRTWLRLMAKGRRAYEAHLAALKAITTRSTRSARRSRGT